MQASFRYGDAVSAKRYPLPVSTAPVWRMEGGLATASIPVPPCPGGHILVPSVSLPQPDAPFQCTLERAGAVWPLETVPSTRPRDGNSPQNEDHSPEDGDTPRDEDDLPFTTAPTGGGEISTHIDCFHTEQDIPETRLLIRLPGTEPPERFLVTLSIRPLLIDPEIPQDARMLLTPPPAISQMQGPAPIRTRICSPTALAMTLAAAQPDISWQAVVDACFDGRFYGSWPLAIRCAGSHGRIGAVEAITSWEPVLRVLGTGSPVVASIRFAPGELPGTPLACSKGHLVTVYGIDGDQVLVNDPAAPDAASVPRTYDLRAFTRAWLRRRGAAYLLAPP